MGAGIPLEGIVSVLNMTKHLKDALREYQNGDQEDRANLMGAIILSTLEDIARITTSLRKETEILISGKEHLTAAEQ